MSNAQGAGDALLFQVIDGLLREVERLGDLQAAAQADLHRVAARVSILEAGLAQLQKTRKDESLSRLDRILQGRPAGDLNKAHG